MPADKLMSDGARAERRAWMSKVRRMRRELNLAAMGANETLDELEKFGTTRHDRYDKSAGGLGKR